MGKYHWLLAGLTAGAGVGLLAAHFGPWPAAIFAGLLTLGLYLALMLRTPERGLWLLAMVLPYERLGALSLSGFTLKLGHIVSAFMLASWAMRSIITKNFRLIYDPLRLPLVAFLAASVLSLINAVNLTRGLFLIGQLLVGYLVYTLVLNFLSRRTVKGVWLALWAGAAAVGAFGLYQFVGDYLGLPTSLTGLSPNYSGLNVFGFARIQSVSLEPLYFANYLLLPLLTAAAYLVGTAGKRRLWLAPYLLGLLVVFVLTLARGAFLGLLAGGLLLLIIYRRRLFRPKVLAVLATSFVVVGAVVVTLLVQSGSGRERPLDAFAKQITGTGSETSSRERIGSITAARELISDHPVIGVGVGNFGSYYEDPFAIPNPDRNFSQVVNNQTLETLVETGLLGLLALAWVVLIAGERTIKAWRAAKGDEVLRAALAGTAAAGLAIAVQAQTFSAIYLIHVWFTLGLLIGIQNLILLPKRSRP